MSLLVISDYRGAPERSRLDKVSKCLRDRIDAERSAQGSVGFVQRRNGAGFEALGIRIGRYEPVFSTYDLSGKFPAALIDFIVTAAPIRIELAGIAAPSVFSRYRSILGRAGYEVRYCLGAILPIDLEAKDRA